MKITAADYRALAELRYRIHHFLWEADAAAVQVGLEPQHYFLLLAVRGLPSGMNATIRTLAERLALKHNTTVELVDRMEKHGYVRRVSSRSDHRCVLVRLLPRGTNLLEQVAQRRISELRGGGAALAEAIEKVLGHGLRSRGEHYTKNLARKTVQHNRE